MRILVVTNMYPTPEQPAFGTFVYDQVQALCEADVEVDVLFVNGNKSKVQYLWGVFKLWGKLLRRRYDLIHAHYALTGLVARMQFLYPLVVTYHGAEVSDYVPKWLSGFARRGQRLFDRIIVVSRREQDAMIGPVDRVRIIPGGIDFDLFRPMPRDEARAQLDLPLDKSLILWAGEHWQYEKRFELVEAAVEVLQADMPDVELVLVSGQPHKVIPLYMNACDVFLLTSRSEGSPTVIKEAIACNLPVISTDVGDVAEVIEGIEGCYLVEPEVSDVVEKLHTVLDNPQRTKGRKNVDYLRGEQIVQRVIDVYNELVSPKK